ncbi:MAG: TetR/AcrR family transcriptional regulator C-terminal domain-containing protein, partial [Actinomycetota bacterium]
RLADALDFKVMSLYNHVANKDDLLAAMVDEIAARVPQPSAGDAPMLALRTFAVNTRAQFSLHRWAPGPWSSTMPGRGRADHMETVLRLLADSDLPPDTAHHGFHAIMSHVVGYSLHAEALGLQDVDLDTLAGEFLETVSAERHGHVITHVHQHLSGDTGESFELVLDFILDGLRRIAH